MLTAQDSLLNNQLSQINLRSNQMTSSVQLMAALGGGWDLSQLPSERDVRKKVVNGSPNFANSLRKLITT